MRRSITGLLFCAIAVVTVNGCASPRAGYGDSRALGRAATDVHDAGVALKKAAEAVGKTVDRMDKLTQTALANHLDTAGVELIEASTGLRDAATASSTSECAPAQRVRIGSTFDMSKKNLDTQSDHDTVIHIKTMDPAYADQCDYFAVVGATKGATEPGRFEYLPAEQRVFASAGWIFASGTWPATRTKRIRATGHGTTIVLQIVAPDSGDPDDGVHRVFFLYPNCPPSMACEEVVISESMYGGSITISCENPHVSADTTAHAYVAPDEDCYLDVDPSGVLDATKIVRTAAWGMDARNFVADIKARVNTAVAGGAP